MHCLLLTCLVVSPVFAAGFPGSNDNLFPSAPAARPFIDFDGKGFLVQGRRTFIVAGSLHYSRVPRTLWRDRLLRIKRAGYNTVQTYTFWNYHELREGQYDFSGDKDFEAYLKLIHSLGMYAIIRIGPYVNAEWEGGGWPVWLRFKPGLIVREDNAPFLTAMDRWMDHLLPIVAREQITRGGPIIMVQLENEDTRGSGTDLTYHTRRENDPREGQPNPYFVHLRNKALSLGITVPHFFSGLNHSDNPAGREPLDLTGRTSPWYSTEFWTGWINVYGSEPGKAARLEEATWRVLAYGGAGYTHYTIAGGTNFDGWNCDEQGTNYDFGAPIGQTGDLRDIYYRVKRAALFGSSFSGILANSVNVGERFGSVAAGVSVSARQSPEGTIVFLDNSWGNRAVATQVKGPDGFLYPTAGPLQLAPGEIVPIVENYPLCPGVKIVMAAARILGISRQGHDTTLVVYGPPGQPIEVHLSVAAGVMKDKPSVIKTKAPSDDNALETFTYYAGPEFVRVLVMNDHLADRTWFVPLQAGGRNTGRNAVVLGPDYVGEASVKGGHLVLETERRPNHPTPLQKAWLFLDADPGPRSLTPTQAFHSLASSACVPVLGAWQTAPGANEAQPGYDDTAWLAGPDPLPMGADGDRSAYAWYRSVIHAPGAGTYNLDLSDAGDWVSVFMNGAHMVSSSVQQRRSDPAARSLKVTLKDGDNSLTLLAAHYGRAKLHAYIGPLDETDKKGVSGAVTLDLAPAQSVEINKFRWQADDRGVRDARRKAAPALDVSGPDWQDATTSTDVFNGRLGSAWFRTILPNISGPHRRIHFNSIDDNGQIFLNGKRIASDVGVNANADISLDSAWQEGGPNVLAVSVQNTAGAGGLLGAVTLQGVLQGPRVVAWRMRGGIRLPGEMAWHSLSAPSAEGGPAFYRTTFRYTPPLPNGPHPILRILPHGLSRGFIWLNSHNLGRYPEKSTVEGLYLPECWMLTGMNTLVVFDEEGQPPSGSALTEEQAASRDNIALIAGR